MRSKAFTLIELAMVVFIMAVVASIAVPRYANFIAQQRAEASARRITTDLAFAQRRARFSSTSHTVRFTLAESKYELLNLQSLDHPGAPYEVLLSEEPYRATIVSVDFGGDSEIVFDGYGAPDTGGTVTVQVGAYQRTIQVDANAG